MPHHVDGLVQDCSISIVNTLEILQSCTELSIWNTLCCKYHLILKTHFRLKSATFIVDWSHLMIPVYLEFCEISPCKWRSYSQGRVCSNVMGSPSPEMTLLSARVPAGCHNGALKYCVGRGNCFLQPIEFWQVGRWWVIYFPYMWFMIGIFHTYTAQVNVVMYSLICYWLIWNT